MKRRPLNPISISEMSQIAFNSASALELLIDFLLLTFLRNEIKPRKRQKPVVERRTVTSPAQSAEE